MNFSRRYRASLESSRLAREDLIGFVRTCGFARNDLRDIEIAVGEAIANAVEHGNKMSGDFRVAALFDDGLLVIDIIDGGEGFSALNGSLANPFRGWGIQLMRNLVDSLTFHEGGTRVRLKKRLTNQTPARREPAEGSADE